MEEEQQTVGNEFENYEIDNYENGFPGEKPSKLTTLKTAIWNHRIKILLCLVIISILIVIALVATAAILIPILVTSGSDDHDHADNQNYGEDPAVDCCLNDFPYHEDIWNTIEYQLAIDETNDFKDRKKEINVWLSQFNLMTGMDFTYSNGNASLRNEYYLKTPNCGSDTIIRVRMYESGPKKGHTTVDSKINAKIQEDVYNAPLYPSRAQSATAYQKAEMDQHECYTKWARETRCLLESPFWFTTCQSVMDLYPGIYPDIKDNQRQLTVSNGSIGHWWILEHQTFEFPTLLKNGTTIYSKLDSTFTLEYNSEADAESGKKAPKYGEWSFRVYGNGAGTQNVINEEVKQYLYDTYQTLVDMFETTSNKC